MKINASVVCLVRKQTLDLKIHVLEIDGSKPPRARTEVQKTIMVHIVVPPTTPDQNGETTEKNERSVYFSLVLVRDSAWRQKNTAESAKSTKPRTSQASITCVLFPGEMGVLVEF